MDLKNDALTAIQSTDFVETTAHVNQDEYHMFNAYLEALSQKCAQLNDEKWKGILKGTGVWTESSCTKLVLSILTD